jgi:predicted PurR-regulated permease PerM
LGRDLLVYTLLRVVLFAVIAVALSIFMPLVVAALFAIVLQLPLAWVLFGRQRRRVNDAIARASRHRRADRDRLRAALAGTVDGSSDTGPR